MTKTKQNRSYLLQTVVSKNGSWNSDFSHSPKSYGETYFASDRALKYSVRNLMEQMGKEILIKKWAKDIKLGKKSSDASDFDVMTIQEIKEYVKTKYKDDFAKVFWNFEDVRHFGMVYDGLGIHGVVQISQGIDLYGKGITYEDDLTGRMVFESKSDKNKETRGMATREFLSEAHFAYDISVNPANVHFLKEIKGFEHCQYSEEDYETLLECLENGPRNVKSSQKLNCQTGLLLRIEMKDEEKTLLSDLQSKLRILPEKEDGKAVYDVEPLFTYLKNKQDIAGKDLYEEIVITFESNDIVLKGVDETIGNVKVVKY